MKRAMRGIGLLGIAVAVWACAGDEEEPHDSSEYLTGEWTRLDGEEGYYVYGEDGQFEMEGDTSDTHVSGTFTADDVLVAMDREKSPVVLTWTYYASAEVYGPLAIVPKGENDGPVGTWFRRVRFRDDASVAEWEDQFELREDGTLTATVAGDMPGSQTTHQGSWRELEPDHYEVEWREDDEDVRFTALLADGRALLPLPWVFARE